MTDRREYRRFRVSKYEGFSRCPHCAGLGPIVEISVGGLSFFFEGTALPGRETIDIFFGNDLFCIRNVPCRKITLESPSSPGERLPHRGVRIGHVQFGHLDRKQLSQLNYLIHLLGSLPEKSLEVTFSRTDS